jgi:hypothetical protein
MRGEISRQKISHFLVQNVASLTTQFLQLQSPMSFLTGENTLTDSNGITVAIPLPVTGAALDTGLNLTLANPTTVGAMVQQCESVL